MTEEREIDGWDLIPNLLTIVRNICPEEFDQAVREGQAHDALYTDDPMADDGR